ncbi:MAG: glycosyltransferase family 4 protein [Methanobacteriaceae archaeon]
MKICFISEFFPASVDLEIKGGVEAAAFNEAYYLSKNHEVTVLSSYEHETPREAEIQTPWNNIKVISCGKKRDYVQKGSFKNRLELIKATYDIGKIMDFDIVVGYNFITYISAWKLSQKLNIPCVARYHDVWIGNWVKNIGIAGIAGEIMERYILSRDMDLILAVSDFTAKNLEKHFSKDKIYTVHNIVEFDKVKSNKYSKTTISCVSRLVEYKRIEDLILAINLLVNNTNNCSNSSSNNSINSNSSTDNSDGTINTDINENHFINKDINGFDFKDLKCKIVGTGPLDTKLKTLVNELNLNKNISFCGFVEKHEDVLKVINSSHMFCLPSKVEGFGIVVVEALGCGVPFIASNIPPVMEASSEKGGLFFNVEDYKDLAKKIYTLLSDNKLYYNLQSEGEEQYSKYKGEYIAKKLENHYLSLID